MKQELALSRIFGIGAAIVMVTQPAWAASNQVIGVRLNPSGAGMEVILDVVGSIKPQVYTTNRGNDVVADVINTQLKLSGGGSYRQNNPAPGIASVVVTPLDANSIRVIVSGSSRPPSSQIIQSEATGIVIGYNTGIANNPGIPNTPVRVPAAAPATTPRQPDVLVQNPEVSINQLPLSGSGSVPPPYLTQATPPPVGDIAVANVDSTASVIALGTSERIPRLVLRDAPVRDVLALLARAADLNLAYTGGGEEGAEDAGGPTISLDIEDELVQDVFNYILRLSSLEANRVGRTIFVGATLPDAARNIITRSFRLNQAEVASAAGFLSAQGAETQRVVEQVQIQTVGTGAAARTVETRNVQIVPLAAREGEGPLLLRGLSVLTDERLNAITLVGEPRKVEIGTRMLLQLDARRRQVAVNVKIVDVNLNNAENFNTSFSFGINDSFFVSDGGSALANFGGFNPPANNTVSNGLVVPSVIPNPLGGTVFSDRDANNIINVPLTAPGPGGQVLRPIPPFGEGGRSDPLTPGISDYTPFEINDGEVEVGDATFSLPELFQYPTRFLATLQAQVVSRNAKILTDPTLVIQEGQRATVNLTEEIVGNIQSTTNVSEGLAQTTVTAQIEEAGLQLEILVSRIDDNGFVTLAVNPTVTAPVGTQTLGDNLGGNEISLLSERSLNSGQIRLRDGQTLILSGIIQEQERSTVTKWPILGDLPILGALFRGTNTDNQRAEVIVLVTPQVMDDTERSGYGYGYAPGQEARDLIDRNR